MDQTQALPWQRYVAVGDSFTEGLEDPGDHRHRGWADRVSELLAQHSEDFQYANLAIRGRRLPDIVGAQLDNALELQPDLISIVGGINDAMRPKWDLDLLADLFESGVARARASGADVIMMTFGDSRERSRTMGAIANRVSEFREISLAIAQAHDCYILDYWPEKIFDDPRFWAQDRLHLNELGHERVAWSVTEALGLGTGNDWREPLPPIATQGTFARLSADANWTVRHLAPFIGRRIRRTSSGDGVDPKHETLQPVRSADGASAKQQQTPQC